MRDGTTLVVGATGTLGSAIVRAVRTVSVGRIVATTRQVNPPLPEGVEALRVDLLDREAVGEALRQVAPIDCLLYAGLYAHPTTSTPREGLQRRRLVHQTGGMLRWWGWIPGLRQAVYRQVAQLANASTPGRENERMFDAVLDAAGQDPHRLQHVGLVTGGKAYGMHLSPHLYPQFRSVMRETDPQAPGPNFYVHQEGRLVDLAHRRGYSFTISRPSYVIGWAGSQGFSLLKAIVAFATLRADEGVPLVFPGDAATADAVFSWCDSEQVGAFHAWALSSPEAHGHIFNVSNGDPRSLRELWPVIADAFGMTWEFRDEGFPAVAYLREQAPRWPEVARQLGDASLAGAHVAEQLANLAVHDWDTTYDLTRLRQAGFLRRVDSAEMFQRWIRRLEERRRARV